MRRLGLAVIAVGLVFLLSGAAAVAWASSQASAMSEDERASDPEQYDFYCSAQSCSLGSVAIGMVIVAIGVLIGIRPVHAAREHQGEVPEEVTQGTSDAERSGGRGS